MPISARKIHYAFINKANHSNSEYLRKLSAAQRDILLNEAKDTVFEYLVKAPEINPEVRNHLRQIERKNISVPCTMVPGAKYATAQLPTDYYRSLRQTVIASKGNCGNRELVVRILQTDKLSESLKSPYWSPSFEYEETIADEGENGLYVWHNDEFTVGSLVMDYYRKVRDIACPSLEPSGSYRDFDGNTVSADVDFELDSTYLWRMIVDVAVLLAKRDNDDASNYQSQLNMIIFKQQLKQI
jgi:hypothetical protein